MSERLPSLRPKQVFKALLRAGFYVHHRKGGHIHFRHQTKSHLRITVPYHSRFDLPPFVINSILKQAELSKKEFLKLLKK